MPSERAQRCFADIIAAIDLIQTWTKSAGGVDQAVHHDMLVRSGIERQFLVISEAAIRLEKLEPDLAGKLAPEIDWPGIRGIGNFIRHKYDDLDSAVIADVLCGRLDELREAAQRALTAIAQSDKL
ncbi:MAG: HepT-like ribonuclease domain-containing protein [Woeseia sp.]